MKQYLFRLNWRLLSVLVLVTVLSSACAQPSLPEIVPARSKALQSELQRDTDPQTSTGDVRALVSGNNEFAIEFYHAVRGGGGNLFFSPYSLSTALAMTYAGARQNTEAQMSDVLHFAHPQDVLHPAFNALDLDLSGREGALPDDQEAQPFELNIANSLWGQNDYPFLPEFLDLLALNYGAGMRLVDFANAPDPARREINRWVETQTEGKIEDLIPEGAIDNLTRLVLANAIYFKADWLTPFYEKDTHDAPFFLLDGGQVNVEMMTSSDPTSFPYSAGEGFQAVELPYVGGEVSLLVLVPDDGDFQTFESGLDPRQMASIRANLAPSSIALTMPKFSFEFEFSLNETLKAMGMEEAFDPGAADFSGHGWNAITLYLGCFP